MEDSIYNAYERLGVMADTTPLWLLFVALCGLVGLTYWHHYHQRITTMMQRFWGVIRPILGWLLIVIGILGMILPGPGLPFFLLGVALVGRRHPLLRGTWVRGRQALRWLTRLPGPVGRSARWGRSLLHQTRTKVRPLMRVVEGNQRRNLMTKPQS